MIENNSNSSVQTPEELIARMEILHRKLTHLNLHLSDLMAERRTMESKISDAQTRIQKILNKLPQTTDTRQLNLLDDGNMETHLDD
jgi:hypothetical protein